MVFNSFAFTVFFPVVVIGYFLLPPRVRWAWLLVASCGFYAAFIPKYLLVLGALILTDFSAALAIEASRGRRRRWALGVSLLANLSMLATFKYFDFVNMNIAALARALHWHYSIPALQWALPIGLSFHTFQAMSYTIEVYRGNQRAERHLGLFALYVMFFPQVVAGPIERPRHLLPQFRELQKFDERRATSGLQLMAWGLFKKVVIADRLAIIVDHIYGSPTTHTGPELLLATILFAYQILCDFSGYSDIAIGAAEVMGFRLAPNFRRPYHATSIADFWSRWHISLSTWFRDYLFLPLTGVRASRARMMINVMIVFLLSGLWHGASWTYVVWGGLHGAYRVIEEASLRRRRDLSQQFSGLCGAATQAFLSRALVFSLVTFAWIFFRASTLSDALYVVRHLATGYQVVAAGGVSWIVGQLGVSVWSLLLVGALLVGLEGVHWYQERHGSLRARIARLPVGQRWSLYYAGIITVMLLGVFSDSSFIYFQF